MAVALHVAIGRCRRPLWGWPTTSWNSHVVQPDAGHGCAGPPGFADQAVIRHPVDGSTWDLGGTREGNHAARIDTWHRLLKFLDARLP